MNSHSMIREQTTLRFKNLLPALFVGLAVLVGCGEDESKRTLSFTTQPADGTAGQALGSIQVTLRNGDNQAVTDAKGEVELSLYVGPEGTTLEGTLRQPLSNGQATFTDVSVPKSGAGYVLKATHEGKEAVSAPFAVVHGAASALQVVTGPSEATVGQPIAPTVQVRVVDARGNLATGATGELTATLVDPASTGAQILGTRTATVSKGLASFSNLTVDKTGDFTLRFSGASLTAAESTSFKVKPGKGMWLAFTGEPSSATAGESLGTVKVEARDLHGNLDDDASGEVQLRLGNASGASLSGTARTAFVKGVATFADLEVVKAGSAYTLEANSAQRVPATSKEFDIAAGAAAKVTFTSAPSSATAGTGFSPAPAVHVEDAYGNATNGTVTLELVSPPTGVTLVGTTQASTTAGDASFSDVTVQKVGTYTLRATLGASGPSATSGTFTVAAAPAASVEFTSAPTTAVAGQDFEPAVGVRVTDAFGNPASGTVTIALATSPATAVLLGTTQAATTEGQVSFAGLSLRKAGSYTLQATVGASGPSATSGTLDVSAAAAKTVTLTAGPTGAVAGEALSPAVTVVTEDAFGNLASGTVRIELANAPAGATLRGATELATTNGTATFSELSLEKAGDYALRSVVVGGDNATGNAFTVVHAAPAQLTFVTQPLGGPSNLKLDRSPVVEIADAFGNVASTASGTVSIALGNNPSGAELTGTLTAAAANGRAAFSDLQVSKEGAGYTLRATLDEVTEDSASFDVGAAITAFVYTDPTQGDLRLVRNAASTHTQLVLDLVAARELTGFGVGFNLPVDVTRARLAADGFVPGAALPPGRNPMAAKAVLPASGPMQGVLVTAQSQKADGAGSMPIDSTIAAGSVLYTLKLELAPGATPGTVFDGLEAAIPQFNGVLRTRAGVDVVSRNGFGIGRLTVIGP
ncbi:hypothetical protein [Hyalangium gracile]|uniref:hypothetical protein n=1 Tax=Hyalangium gracile TaxID=394092 RepID=UPI001CCC2F09|nr:hypothetical protein [Hyalangium gracile]